MNCWDRRLSECHAPDRDHAPWFGILAVLAVLMMGAGW